MALYGEKWSDAIFHHVKKFMLPQKMMLFVNSNF